MANQEAKQAEVTAEKVTAMIEVKVTPQRGVGFDAIAERIYSYPEVTAVYLMSGAYDFTVILESDSLQKVSEFVAEKLSPIDAVVSTVTHFILKKYKEGSNVLIQKSKDERMLFTL